MSIQRKKKPVEFHFVDMNDPERYKKLKVARACDFCRRRKSKCDIGIPGSGTCSNCQKHNTLCIFSPVTPSRASDTANRQESLLTPKLQTQSLFQFPLLLIQGGQVGYERIQQHSSSPVQTPNSILQEPSLAFESQLFQVYFDFVHPAFPVLLKQSVVHIHSQDQALLPRGLRYAIMALACYFLPPQSGSSTPTMKGESDLQNTSLCFYREALESIRHARLTNFNPPRLDIVQTLLLLYKYKEITQQPYLGLQHLEDAQDILCRIQATVPQQQEMITRARWILITCIALGNLSNSRFNQLYNRLKLPDELPRVLPEEIEDDKTTAFQRINQFDQHLNLSLLYSHTIYLLTTGSVSDLICLQRFRDIRQHWYSTLHPIIQNQLLSLCTFEVQEIDNAILYSAILYDMLYLLLLQHYHLPETEWDGVETAYRLQRMIYTWTRQSSFKSAIQSRRMASFGLILCLNTHLSRDEELVDVNVVDQIRSIMTYTQTDSRVDRELEELHIQLKSKKSCSIISHHQQSMDYFSLDPQPMAHSAPSSPLDYPPLSTPGLGDILSTATNDGLSTPIREEESSSMLGQTAEWIIEQQRQQQLQFQVYQSQQHSFPTLFPPITSFSTNSYPTIEVTAETMVEQNYSCLSIHSQSSNGDTADYFIQAKTQAIA